MRAGLRNQMEDLTGILGGKGAGLLITIDEIHRESVSELRQLTSVIQHCFRSDREVAFAAAGLPSAVSDLLSGEVLTFIRRADRHHLGSVAIADVAHAIRSPIEANGRRISENACGVATEATEGYPFLIQLVGLHMWRQHQEEIEISVDDARSGVAAAERHMGSLVHEPALADLSPVGRSFLLAMAQDDGPSHMGDLARRLRVDANYAGQYRLRLLAAEIIQPAGYGSVDFALPYLREYLREHAESLMAMGLQPWTMGPTVGDSEEELPALPPRTEPDP